MGSRGSRSAAPAPSAPVAQAAPSLQPAAVTDVMRGTGLDPNNPVHQEAVREIVSWTAEGLRAHRRSGDPVDQATGRRIALNAIQGSIAIQDHHFTLQQRSILGGNAARHALLLIGG